MAQSSIPQLPGAGGRVPKGVFGVVGLTVIVVALFGLYLVSPFFTVGEYERTVVTRFGQFSPVAGPGLHFRIRDLPDRHPAHAEGSSQHLHGRQPGARRAGDAELPHRRG